MNIKPLVLLALLCSLLLISDKVLSQELLNKNDLSQINVDQLSDAEISKFTQQLAASGLTIDQAEHIALSKGMPASEFTKLKQRLQPSGNNSAPISGNTVNTGGTVASSSADRAAGLGNESGVGIVENKKAGDSYIFGSELFNNASLSFEPNLKIATPMNYELGVDDRIQILVYGVQETSWELTISPEGGITIPNVGYVQLAGLNIEVATEKIKQVMGKTAYSTLSTGKSRLVVTLAHIRSINVTIIGAAKPGNYTISSLSTVFNALHNCGGPATFGSYRKIELIRNNKIYKIIDLYRFLLTGDQSDNVRLKDNDVLRIPVYTKRVELKGQVKRPGIFELLDNEKFKDLLTYSSGFTDTAYRSSVKVLGLTEKEHHVKDLSASDFDKYTPATGDVFVVSDLLNRFKNRVNITGAVFREGFFELLDGMTIADLVNKADGLREDAYTGRGQVIRVKNDLTREMLSFDVLKALKGDPGQNLALKREDEVIITSVLDLKNELKVSIQGEIREPGEYKYFDNVSLKDLVILAGGFTDAAQPKRIEIARLIRRDTLTLLDERASEILEINNGEDLSVAGDNVQLRPFDIVVVRKMPGYTGLQTVSIVGEVQYPGPYVVASRSEKVSDLIRRAGGITPEGYLAGSYLKRHLSEAEKALKNEKINKIRDNLQDSSNKILGETVKDYDQVPLNLEYIMAHPGSIEDLVLVPNDEIFISRFNEQVRISGNVLSPTLIPFNRKYSLKDYLSAAGGTSDYARKSKTFVLYPNGKASATRHFLFFKKYPAVKPGSEIIVPRKRERRAATTGETIGIASALTSLAGVVIAIINSSK